MGGQRRGACSIEHVTKPSFLVKVNCCTTCYMASNGTLFCPVAPPFSQELRSTLEVSIRIRNNLIETSKRWGRPGSRILPAAAAAGHRRPPGTAAVAAHPQGLTRNTQIKN